MCGIAGFNWPDPDLLARMTGAMIHRGPDGEGLFTDGQVSLGHRRLAVYDPSPAGRQPMEYHGRLMVCNGAVYNHRELRAELAASGHSFRSGSDTEVLLAACEQWGAAALDRCNGMWAFCLYDPAARTLFLARDRWGVKPLYYRLDGDRFLFASELQALRIHPAGSELDAAALNHYFYQKYTGIDRTIWTGCHQLPPGHLLQFGLEDRRLRISRWYHLEEEVKKYESVPLRDRLAATGELLSGAVELRRRADVPAGCFLSGGVDSSLIAALAGSRSARPPAFSMGFREKTYDERADARRVAAHLHLDHHTAVWDATDETIRPVIEGLDEPFGDASLLPVVQLARLARQSVTVCLSGDGGDEVFGGYGTYRGAWLASRLPASLIRLAKPWLSAWPVSDRKVTLLFRARRFVRDYSAPPGWRHLDWMATFPDPARRELLPADFLPAPRLLPPATSGDLLSLQLHDFQHYLAGDILPKMDRAAMANSLEVRSPFLDFRLVPLVLSLPEEYKLRGLTGKWLLRQLARRHLPRRTCIRIKRGFTAPLARWMRTSPWFYETLTGPRFFRHGLLNRELAGRLLEGHLSGRRETARELWLIFVFNLWADRHAPSGVHS